MLCLAVECTAPFIVGGDSFVLGNGREHFGGRCEFLDGAGDTAGHLAELLHLDDGCFLAEHLAEQHADHEEGDDDETEYERAAGNQFHVALYIYYIIYFYASGFGFNFSSLIFFAASMEFTMLPRVNAINNMVNKRPGVWLRMSPIIVYFNQILFYTVPRDFYAKKVSPNNRLWTT
jgi:hypothetical protein